MTPTQTPSEKPGEMAVELKACPHCGESQVLHTIEDRGKFRISCHECGAAGPAKESRAKAAKAWNTRAAQLPAKPSELVEWTFNIVGLNPDDPFDAMPLKIVDVGHSDKILTLALREEGK